MSATKRMKWVNEEGRWVSACGRFEIAVDWVGCGRYEVLTDRKSGNRYPHRTLAGAKAGARALLDGRYAFRKPLGSEAVP
jgi:hypothetical protein